MPFLEPEYLPLFKFPTSQIVENFLVWDFYKRKTHGFFVEVGANDPFVYSQTWLLERYGWKGILIEPQASCCELLRRKRKNSLVFQVACASPEQAKQGETELFLAHTASSLQPNVFDLNTSYQETALVKLMTLNDVLEQANILDKIDFLSIDTEGSELDILEGFDLDRYQPSLILVEYHVYSLKLHNYLAKNYYKLIKRTKNNNWYIPKAVEYSIKFGEHLELMRKMYLGTPFRKMKLFFKRLAVR
jgi:FkbM family methyltransferase